MVRSDSSPGGESTRYCHLEPRCCGDASAVTNSANSQAVQHPPSTRLGAKHNRAARRRDECARRLCERAGWCRARSERREEEAEVCVRRKQAFRRRAGAVLSDRSRSRRGPCPGAGGGTGVSRQPAAGAGSDARAVTEACSARGDGPEPVRAASGARAPERTMTAANAAVHAGPRASSAGGCARSSLSSPRAAQA